MSTESGSLAGLSRDLTENGLTFLHRSVTEMRAQPATLRSLSFAIVDLAAAVEVLMKARLVREHWTLICCQTRQGDADTDVGGYREDGHARAGEHLTWTPTRSSCE